MSLSDPIADLLTSIRNALTAGHPAVSAPYSRMKETIVEALREEGYLLGSKSVGEGAKKLLCVSLKYHDKRPVISKLKRVSRPGLRVYSKVGDLPRVMGGLGIVVVATSQGVMSGNEARRLGIGGEVICLVE